MATALHAFATLLVITSFIGNAEPPHPSHEAEVNTEVDNRKEHIGQDTRMLYTCVNQACEGTDIPYLPPLPPGITELNLKARDYNLNDTFFINVTGVTRLVISGEITHVSSTAFKLLTRLAELYVFLSKINYTQFLAAVCPVKSLKMLGIVLQSFHTKSPPPNDLFHRCSMPHVQNLYLVNDAPYNTTLDMAFFAPLTHLRVLSYADWSAVDIIHARTLPQLETFFFQGSKIKTLNFTEYSLLKGLKVLSLSHRKMSGIFSSSLIFPQLKWFNLSYNSFKTLNLSSFPLMPQLTGLDMSHNDISVILGTPILPALENLNLSSNSIDTLDLNTFYSLKMLKHLDLSHNTLSSSFKSDHLPSLQNLNLRGNFISTLPETCTNGQSFFPQLSWVDLTDNVLQVPPEPICLPKLQKLFLNENRLLHVNLWYFSKERFPYLTAVDLSSQQALVTLFDMESKTTAVRSVDLSYNIYLHFNDDVSVRTGSFRGCPNLTKLNLSNTNFNGVDAERFTQLFGNLKRLKELSLRSTRINRISAGMFSSLVSLESLDLSDNKLVHLPDAGFLSCHNLTMLNLSFNQIPTVQESTFLLATRKRLQQLDLSANPFECSCEALWLKQWLLDNPALFSKSSARYDCDNLPDGTVQSFFLQEQTCLLSQETSKFIIATVTLLFSVLMSVTCLYRYRWHIRLVLFEAARGKDKRARRLIERHFDYDVFVSYDKEDFLWVRHQLMPELEEGMGLRLCIHQRDFTPGAPIVENIMENVQASKKVLMVFSVNFAKSHWCQFELQLCLTHALETGDVLLVVLLHDVPPRDLTPAMMAVMKTTTYIEWDDDPDARASFWRRIMLALREILPGVRDE